jgi:hypothetical protein
LDCDGKRSATPLWIPWSDKLQFVVALHLLKVKQQANGSSEQVFSTRGVEDANQGFLKFVGHKRHRRFALPAHSKKGAVQSRTAPPVF